MPKYLVALLTLVCLFILSPILIPIVGITLVTVGPIILLGLIVWLVVLCARKFFRWTPVREWLNKRGFLERV